MTWVIVRTDPDGERLLTRHRSDDWYEILDIMETITAQSFHARWVMEPLGDGVGFRAKSNPELIASRGWTTYTIEELHEDS